MYHHYHGNLNPWKLGGYGMYTIPNIRFVSYAHSIEGIYIKKIDYTNDHLWGGCLSGISDNFYKEFIKKDSELLKYNKAVILYLTQSNRDMETRERHESIIGYVTITKKENSFQIEEIFCDKERTLSIDVPK